jgi:DNA-binding transcriptional LysR family regulator
MLSELKAFVLLAETGSVQAVARHLPLTQPAVTRQLQRLESMLGATLLDRRAKPARLTPAGLAVLPQARKVLAGMDELKLAASSDAPPQGVLRLGVAHALAEPALADSLHALSKRYPALSLQLASGWTSDLLQRVERGELDAAIVYVAGASDAMAPPPGRVLASDDIVFLVGRDARLGARPRLAELNALGWVLTPDAVCGSRGALRAAVERDGGVLHVAAEVHDIALQASLVARGLGVGMLPKRRAAALPRGNLRRINVQGVSLRMAVSLVRTPFLGRLEKALDALESRLAEHLPGKRSSAVRD